MTSNKPYATGDRVRIVTPDFGLINQGKEATVVRHTLGVMVKIDGYAYPIEMYPDDIEPISVREIT
jgi:hypothetical protein